MMLILSHPGWVVLLVVMLVLSTFLANVREDNRLSLAQWIPRLLFFRLSLIVALFVALLIWLGVGGDWIKWLGFIADQGLKIAVIEAFVDFGWRVYLRFKTGIAPPEIFKTFIIFGMASFILLEALNGQGLLTTFSAAAVFGGLAFLLGPGASSQIANISSAISMQIERQFSIGDWVEIQGELGRIDNISWNSTYLYDDLLDRHVVIPNALVDQGIIYNFSRPSSNQYWVKVQVGLPYDMPPGVAAELLKGVVKDHPKIAHPTRAKVLFKQFNDSSIDYILTFMISDFSLRNRLRTEIASRIWYALERSEYSIPFPVVDLRTQRSTQQDHLKRDRQEQELNLDCLRCVELFNSLSSQELMLLASQSSLLAIGPGEFAVHAGDPGTSMYVVRRGCCAVYTSDYSEQPFAHLYPRMVFGETSALTGEVRTATVRAVGHVVLMKISQELIQQIFVSNQAAMGQFAQIMAIREAELKDFTPAQQHDFGLSLMERMRQTFSRLISGGTQSQSG